MSSLKIASKTCICDFYVLTNTVRFSKSTHDTFFQSLFSLPKYSLSYPTQNSDTKNFCVDMLGGLHFEGRQKKATPSPMCAIHFCIGYSSSVAQFYREKIKYTNIANKFLKTNGYFDFIH